MNLDEMGSRNVGEIIDTETIAIVEIHPILDNKNNGAVHEKGNANSNKIINLDEIGSLNVGEIIDIETAVEIHSIPDRDNGAVRVEGNTNGKKIVNMDTIEVMQETQEGVHESAIQKWINSSTKETSKLKLKDLLQSPTTPKRKGVRKVPKLNFVLTGRAAKIMQLNKINEKEKEIREKEEKKAEREKKKLEKEKGKSRNKTKKVEKNECEKCHEEVVENPIVCLTCEKAVVHLSCLNDAVNDTGSAVCKDDAIFVCDMCVNECEHDPDNFGL